MAPPNLVPFVVPAGTALYPPTSDPATWWPAEQRQVYEDPNNTNSPVIADWRFTNAVSAYRNSPNFTPPVGKIPWDRAHAPQWQKDWIDVRQQDYETFDQAPKPSGWRKIGEATEGGDWVFEPATVDPKVVAWGALKKAMADFAVAYGLPA